MASEVGIVNRALRAIGESTITSLTEGSRNANVANDIYEQHRDELLRAHPWNFATKRIKLARSANTPVYEYDYQYPIPSDFLRIVEVHDNTDGLGTLEYKMEHDATDGTVIYSFAEEVWLRYVAKITDPNKMSPDFRKALSMSMAVEFATAIAQSNTLSDLMESRYRRALSKARSNDGMEDFPEQFPAGSWVSRRFTEIDF